jgi:hypothetical protein
VDPSPERIRARSGFGQARAKRYIATGFGCKRFAQTRGGLEIGTNQEQVAACFDRQDTGFLDGIAIGHGFHLEVVRENGTLETHVLSQ